MNNLIYLSLAQKIAKLEGWPVFGEAFKGHPDDPTVLEEYYLYDVPEDIHTEILIKNSVSRKWELHSNVLTIYNHY